MELNSGENSLQWKANMLPLFTIMTLCPLHAIRLTLHDIRDTVVYDKFK